MTYASVRRHTFVALAVATLVALLPLGATTAADAATARTVTTTSVHAVAKTTTKTTVKKQSPKAIAHALVRGKKYRWSEHQYGCLKALWSRESGWRVSAGSPGRAYGIPQALPGKKMGSGWRHSATAQIKWGLKYIDGRYGTPCRADHHQRVSGWY